MGMGTTVSVMRVVMAAVVAVVGKPLVLSLSVAAFSIEGTDVVSTNDDVASTAATWYFAGIKPLGMTDEVDVEPADDVGDAAVSGWAIGVDAGNPDESDAEIESPLLATLELVCKEEVLVRLDREAITELTDNAIPLDVMVEVYVATGLNDSVNPSVELLPTLADNVGK